LQGKGAMPPRGGTSPDDYSDYEIARAVVYMADHSGANFPEPPAPASGAAATQNAAAPEAAASAAQSASAATGAVNDQAAAAIAALPNAPAPASSAADKAQAGKALYTQVCQACHAAGVMGAPKFGNKDDWAPRLKEPMDVIYNYALHGKGNMPPKGGSQASDDDVKAAVDYMVNAAK
jgi:cytochrome c5